MQFRKNGRDARTVSESPQLIDNINTNFCPIGESSEKLRLLRVKSKLSMRELSKATGHSRSYLRQQLRKFDIRQEKEIVRLAPFGWNWQSGKLIRNAKEQGTLREIIKLNRRGLGSKSIASDLNKREILSKTGGRWHASSIRNILKRAKCAASQS